MIFFADQTSEEEIEETEDTDSELDDAVLEEIGEPEDEETDETEGFGLIEEDGKDDLKKDTANPDEDDEEDEEEASLEEDAEDVDYDTFDDIDEM